MQTRTSAWLAKMTAALMACLCPSSAGSARSNSPHLRTDSEGILWWEGGGGTVVGTLLHWLDKK